MRLWVCAAALIAITLAGLGYLQDWDLKTFVGVFALQIGIYGYSAWSLFRGSLFKPSLERHALIAILIVAALLRGIALFAPQALSTDAFRYVWDGRVQAAGINPYRYIPADPALTALRDESIYPNINRAEYAPTIYPPTAQIAFLAIERVSDSITGMKIGMLAFDAISIACLIALLRRNGLPTTRVLLYAWHPLPVWEFAGSGHVDAVAIALVLLAFLAASRRASGWAGIALAAATLVKFYPAVVAPALYRRWDWRMPVAFAVTLVLLYMPYLSVGPAVFGFLSGYADEEGLRNGNGIFLWSIVKAWAPVPEHGLPYFAPFATLVMLVAALLAQCSNRLRTQGDFAPALLLASVFTLLVSPHDPWYFTWLVPFLCFRFSIAHVWLTAACTLLYVLPDPTGLRAQSLIYGPFLLLLFFQYVVRRQLNPSETLHANRAHSHLGA